MKKKIFCIGLNKTGTLSLHEAFKILGIKSVHYTDDDGNDIKNIIKDNYLEGCDILKGLEKYEAISDWDLRPYSHLVFKEFDKQYPNSKFILNTRDLKAWLNSREKHVKRNQKLKSENPEEDIKWLKVNRPAWKKQFELHYNEVYKYFKGRENDLLVFDVTKGDGWKKLCPFLGLSIPAVPFPENNISPKEKSFFQKLFRFMQMPKTL